MSRRSMYWKHAETVNTTSYLLYVSPRRDGLHHTQEISCR
jgi:hypothetical protein